MRFSVLILYTFFCVLGLHAQNSKMSPYVRQAMMTNRVIHKSAKAKSLNGRRLSSVPTITAFVRTTDTDVLRQQGCRIYAQWDDIVIASIPLDKLSDLAKMPQVQRIEAGESCSVTNDTTAIITRAMQAWKSGSPSSTNSSSLTGSGVVVGVMDIGFDLTHPTFYSADGKTYRIKQLWDQLDLTTGGEVVAGKDTIYVGRQYIGTDSLLKRQHTFDGLIEYHGTHTSGTAAGSGWEGNYMSLNRYSGMAPDADICLVSNAVGSNAHLIPEEDFYKYTNATDMLGFKYIFDYAESVGKPCVINFSEGAYDDLYQSGIYGEVLSKMVGAGRILCASAGNEGYNNTYIHKAQGEKSKGAFLVKSASSTAIYVLRSPKPVQMRLSFYNEKSKVLDKEYDLTELAQFPDSLMMDSIYVNSDTIVVMLETYPSCFDENLYATDLILLNLSKENIGLTTPVSLTLLGEDNDVEAICGGAYFATNKLDPSLADYEKTHNVLFPGSSKDAICVGSNSHRVHYKNSANIWRSPYPTSDNNGKKSRYSSTGPAMNGEVKPDVIAPGINIISSYNSFYRENKPSVSVDADIREFTNNNRKYQWHALAGTSMSSPVVTGIVALWLQVCPTLTPDQVKDVIAHTSTHYDESLQYPNNDYGWGQIDALAGIDYIRQTYTGIVQIENDEWRMKNSEAIYTLDGRRVSISDSHQGLFIVVKDGKARKVVKR